MIDSSVVPESSDAGAGGGGAVPAPAAVPVAVPAGENNALVALSRAGIDLRELALLMEKAKVDVPQEVGELVPEVCSQLEVCDLSERIGDFLAPLAERGFEALYNMGGIPKTVEEESGKLEVMDAARFVSWLGRRVKTFTVDRKSGEKVYGSISEQRAKQILVDKEFLRKLPELKAVNAIKLPVVREDGRVELLKPGFDAESGIYTAHGGVAYDENMDAGEARIKWRKLHKHFLWGDSGRSKAVHLAAALSGFCRGMLAGCPVPMFLYNANRPGSGKGRLVEFVLCGVFGQAGTTALHAEPANFRKEMNAVAENFQPFVFFDNIKGFLANAQLEEWLTTPTWNGRVIGTGKSFSVEIQAITVMSGNQLTLGDDMKRRTLWVDLFADQAISKRVLPPDVVPMTKRWVMQHRGEILAMLWAFVRNYFDAKSGKVPKVNYKAPRSLGSFEDWSDLVPHICLANTFFDPTEEPDLPDAGNTDEADREKTIVRAIEKFLLPSGRQSVNVTLSQMAGCARDVNGMVSVLGTMEDTLRDLLNGKRWPKREFRDALQGEDGEFHVSGVREPETDEEKRLVAAEFLGEGTPQAKSMSTSFGRWIRKELQGLFVLGGKKYRFGDRKNARGSTFLLREE